jgi:hypothetical protein
MADEWVPAMAQRTGLGRIPGMGGDAASLYMNPQGQLAAELMAATRDREARRKPGFWGRWGATLGGAIASGLAVAGAPLTGGASLAALPATLGWTAGALPGAIQNRSLAEQLAFGTAGALTGGVGGRVAGVARGALGAGEAAAGGGIGAGMIGAGRAAAAGLPAAQRVSALSRILPGAIEAEQAAAGASRAGTLAGRLAPYEVGGTVPRALSQGQAAARLAAQQAAAAGAGRAGVQAAAEAAAEAAGATAPKAVAKAALGRSGWYRAGRAVGRVPGLRFLARHPVIGGVVLGQLAAGNITGAFRGMGRDENKPADLRAFGVDLGLSAADSERRARLVDQLEGLGYNRGEAITTIYGSLIQQVAQDVGGTGALETPEQLAWQAMASQLMSPYVSQLQASAQQQAEALRAIVPRLPAGIRPVEEAFIANQQALQQQYAASLGLAAQSVPYVIRARQQQAAGGGVNDLLAQLFLTESQQQK